MMKFSSAAFAVVAAVGLAACGSSNSSSSSGGTGTSASAGTAATTGTTNSGGSTAATGGSFKKDGSEKVSFSDPTGAAVGFQQLYAGFKQGASEIGWSASQDDAALSPTKQVSNIQTMISQKMSGIASWTLDQGAASGAYVSAEKAGIPVIGINSTGPGIKTTVWWAVNKCGTNSPIYQTAAFIAKAYPHAKTLVIGGPPVPSIEAYVVCFKKAALKYGLDIEAEQNNTNDTPSSAQPIISSLLTKYPGTQAIWNFDDDTALGASAALTAVGKQVWTTSSKSGVLDLGQNGNSDAITAIKQSRMTGTWDTNNNATGLAAIKALQYYIGPNKTSNPPSSLTVRSLFFTKANIDSYKAPGARGYNINNIPLAK
jgi:ribose transport system substrate-binding protein